MGFSSLPNPKGILWFSLISVGIVLFVLVIWFVLLYNSNLRVVDRILYHETSEIAAVLESLDINNPTEIGNLVNVYSNITLDGRRINIEIYDTQRSRYIKKAAPDSGISLFSAGYSELKKPITIEYEKDTSYRLYARNYNGLIVYTFIALPTFHDQLIDNFSDFSVIIPILAIVLAAIGIWNMIRFSRPIQSLDMYLQSLIQQPLVKDIETRPPLYLKGEIQKLTLTVSKIVERLQVSRNQAIQFSSFASHELRTPLSTIRSQLESALNSQTEADELKALIASIYDEMLRLSKSVEDLLSLATMQTGTSTLNLETISLQEFLNKFYDEALLLSRPKNITVVLKKGPDVYLEADFIKLRQVFFNLLDNAIKNTPSGNRIHISYTIKDPDVIIMFSDSGIGIPPDKLEHIFEPFFTYGQKNESNKSIGLGLALVRWIIELHHGRISVLSDQGIGTEFKIFLPYKKVGS
jgi:signal transduction histidine kinase